MSERDIVVQKTVREVGVFTDPSGASPSGAGSGTVTAPFNLVGTSLGTVPFTITGYSGQTADLQRWNNSAGVTLARITNTGTLVSPNIPSGTLVTTTTGDTRYPLLSTLTTKGDIYVATAAGTLTRLAVGSNNQVLAADSTTATGLRWGATGSGYNTIQNPAGTALASRAALQFTGTGIVSVVDDSVNGKTVVTINTGTGGGGTPYNQTIYLEGSSLTQKAGFNFADTSSVNLSIDSTNANYNTITADVIFAGTGTASTSARSDHTHANVTGLTQADADLLYDVIGAANTVMSDHLSVPPDLGGPHPEYVLGQSADFALASHSHDLTLTQGQLTLNRQFNNAATSWTVPATANVTPTYPTASNLTTTALQLVFANTTAVQTISNIQFPVPLNSGVKGIYGSYSTYSDKNALVKVRVVTTTDPTVTNLTTATTGATNTTVAIFSTGVNTKRTPRWHALFDSTVAIVKVYYDIYPDPDATAPVTFQTDDFFTKWISVYNQRDVSQVQGFSANIGAVNSVPSNATLADPPPAGNLLTQPLRVLEDRGGYIGTTSATTATVPNGFEGIHVVELSGAFAANATASTVRQILLLRNGTVIKKATVNGLNLTTEPTPVSLVWTGMLRNGDVLTAAFNQNVGSAINMRAAEFFLNAWRIEDSNPALQQTLIPAAPPNAGFHFQGQDPLLAQITVTAGSDVTVVSDATGNYDSITYDWGE